MIQVFSFTSHLLLLQFRSDCLSLFPGRVSTQNAIRIIRITRNNHGPVFLDGSCDLTVNAAGVGTVIRVQASDADAGEYFL